MKRAAALLGLAATLGGCAYVGPRALESTRPRYNEAIANTNDQELLLNLVRMRYRDTTYFTSVERIAASLEMNMSIGATGTYSNTASTAAKNTIGRIVNIAPGSIAMNEKPTIFYAPLEGEKFVRQMMTPINAEAVRALRALQRDNRLDLVKTGEKAPLEMRFTRGSATSPEAMRFKQLAGIAPEADRVRIEVAAEPADKASLALSTRPVMAALHFLATGVEVPEADLVAGKVRRTVRADGTPFDWQEMLGELFRVRSAASEPDDASTAVNYRGTWFYIPDNDLEAKSTFVLMTQIIALHSAPPASIAPLTYSIGK